MSFSLERGTILGVIGPNGAGKTTLLKVLARVTPPTEGRVVGHGTVAPLLELGAGLQPEMTARENISMCMAWNGLSRADIEQRTGDIVAFAEIEEFIDTPLKRFSNGMYVRLAFSMAINMQPDVLLADNPGRRRPRVPGTVPAAGRRGRRRGHDRVLRLARHGGDSAAVHARHPAQRRPPGARRRSGNGREPLRAVGLDDGGRGAKRGKKGSHVSEHGEILSVRLLSSEGREIGAVQHDEDIHLRVLFSALTPGITAVRAVISMMARGVVAFRTPQPADLTVEEPGIFAIRVRNPAHLLADTIYTVKVGILLVADGQQSTLVMDHALVFASTPHTTPTTRAC